MFHHLGKFFIILLATLSFQNVYGQSSLGYVEGDVIIKFKDSPEDPSVMQSLSGDSGDLTLQGVSGSVSLSLQSSFNNFSMHHFSGIEDGQSTEEIIEQVGNHPDIEYIEPNYIISKTNTDATSSQSSYNNPDPIFAEDARNAVQNLGNEMVKIAVIDTGTEVTHKDLQGIICNNTEEVAGDGYDNDGNGFDDDVHGWNFTDHNEDLGDCDGHGTHVAGIIKQTVVGEASESAAFCIMPLKFLGCDGIGSTSSAINAIDYAIDNGAKVLNNSWGNDAYSNALHEAVTRSYNAGVVFVAAAGNNASNNDTTPFYPASYPIPHVISVAATTFNDIFASTFSNYGVTSVHLAAPGVNVNSAYPNNQSTNLSGTSMATPYVSGVTALTLYAQPQLNGYEVKEIVLNSADTLSSLSGYVQDERRLNALKAVSKAQGYNPSFVMPEYSSTVFSSSSSMAGGCGLVHNMYSNLHQMKSYKNGGKGRGGHLPRALFSFMLALPLMVWLFLKQKATSRSKRREQRYEVDIPLHLSFNNHFMSANLFSISQGGAGISIDKSTHQLKRGSQIDLLLSKQDGEDTTLSGKIVWMSENKVGIKFKEKATWITKFSAAHRLSTSKNT